jgi:hypothetical protein
MKANQLFLARYSNNYAETTLSALKRMGLIKKYLMLQLQAKVLKTVEVHSEIALLICAKRYSLTLCPFSLSPKITRTIMDSLENAGYQILHLVLQLI